FGSVLRVMERSGNTLSPVLRAAWDATDLRIMTKNSPVSASGAHISVIGHITRDELLKRVDDSDLWNGFANRFLWCMAARKRLLPHGGAPDESVIRSLEKDLAKTVRWARKLKSRRVTWKPSAAKMWEDIYPRLAAASPGLFGAVTSRAEAQT